MAEETLSPAQRSKIRRLSAPAEPQPGDEAGELNVVPYLDIIMNVMMFVLASVSVAFASTIPSSAARSGPSSEVRPVIEGMRFTALITHDGVALKTAGGSIGPGCGSLGPGVTVPKVSGAQDLTGLTECARRIKGSRPEFASETQVTVAASPDVPYSEVVSVMDSLRSDADGSLFPEVTLGAVR